MKLRMLRTMALALAPVVMVYVAHKLDKIVRDRGVEPPMQVPHSLQVCGDLLSATFDVRSHRRLLHDLFTRTPKEA